MLKQDPCPICHEELISDQCMIDCAAGHIIHYQCICNSIKIGMKMCPLDRQNIAKCLHNGNVKTLPNPPPKQPEPQAQYIQYQQTPCYICHCNTRGDLQFDQVVVCSGCENIFVHAECEEQNTGETFDYGFMWFCPPCKAERVRNNRRRTRGNINNRR